MIDLKEVLTIPEAAEKYSVSEATLKFACAGRAAGGKTYPPGWHQRNAENQGRYGFYRGRPLKDYLVKTSL